MAVPKRRTSRSRARTRKSHNAIKPLNLTTCPQCNAPVPNHSVCPQCGHYHGRSYDAGNEE